VSVGVAWTTPQLDSRLVHRYSKRAKRLLDMYDLSPAPKIIEVDLRGSSVGFWPGFCLCTLCAFSGLIPHQDAPDASDTPVDVPKRGSTWSLARWIRRPNLAARRRPITRGAGQGRREGEMDGRRWRRYSPVTHGDIIPTLSLQSDYWLIFGRSQIPGHIIINMQRKDRSTQIYATKMSQFGPI